MITENIARLAYREISPQALPLHSFFMSMLNYVPQQQIKFKYFKKYCP